MVYNCINNILTGLGITRCLICKAIPEKGSTLCKHCISELPYNRNPCQGCALPMPLLATETHCGNCLSHPPLFDRAVAPLMFESPVDRLINDLKFHHRLALGPLLAQLLSDVITRQGQPLPDLLLPIPLHPLRLRERGYNQSLELARPVGKRLHLPVDLESCQRTRMTEAQSSLDRKHRLKNLRGAFKVTENVAGRHIALVDDVMTTGSTANEMARVLKRVGASRVDIWVAARTDPSHHHHR